MRDEDAKNTGPPVSQGLCDLSEVRGLEEDGRGQEGGSSWSGGNKGKEYENRFLYDDF